MTIFLRKAVLFGLCPNARFTHRQIVGAGGLHKLCEPTVLIRRISNVKMTRQDKNNTRFGPINTGQQMRSVVRPKSVIGALLWFGVLGSALGFSVAAVFCLIAGITWRPTRTPFRAV